METLPCICLYIECAHLSERNSGSVGWMSSHGEHRPGLRVWSLVGVRVRCSRLMFLFHISVSPALSPSLSPSLKIIKNLRTVRFWVPLLCQERASLWHTWSNFENGSLTSVSPAHIVYSLPRAHVFLSTEAWVGVPCLPTVCCHRCEHWSVPAVPRAPTHAALRPCPPPPPRLPVHVLWGWRPLCFSPVPSCGLWGSVSVSSPA